MPIVNTFSNGSARALGWTSGGAKKILISSTPGPAATITTYSGYIVFKFTASATLNVGIGTPGSADALIVAGGSPGGNTGTGPVIPSGGPGGNGGKVRAVPGTSITSNTPIPVVIGGASTNSTFGPLSSSSGANGGTGGTGGTPSTPIGGAGGNGPSNDYLTGSPQFWSGGGGGGRNGAGGQAGGGTGGPTTPFPGPFGGPRGNPGGAGTVNTGGGGGGGGIGSQPPIGIGGAGGSGIVIVRFPDAQFTTS